MSSTISRRLAPLTLGILICGGLIAASASAPAVAPAKMSADPNAWLAYWLPQGIVMELFALIGVGGMVYLPSVNSSVLTGPGGAMYRLGSIIDVAGCAVIFVVLDIIVIARVRRVARQQAAAYARDAIPPP